MYTLKQQNKMETFPEEGLNSSRYRCLSVTGRFRRAG